MRDWRGAQFHSEGKVNKVRTCLPHEALNYTQHSEGKQYSRVK